MTLDCELLDGWGPCLAIQWMHQGSLFLWVFVTLPSLPPAVVGLDIQDEMGRHEVGHIDNSMKIPLNNGVGCRFEGQFSINKVGDPAWSPLACSPSPPSPSSLETGWWSCASARLPSPGPWQAQDQRLGTWQFLLRILSGDFGLPEVWSPSWPVEEGATLFPNAEGVGDEKTVGLAALNPSVPPCPTLSWPSKGLQVTRAILTSVFKSLG